MSPPDTHSPDRDNPPESIPTPGYASMQSVTDSGMPMHMFPLTSMPTSTTLRSKRKQVKNACTNCQKACKKCDECRPCLRCVKYGHPDQCVDSQRKERKKGVKRGKYKKRDGKGTSVDLLDGPFGGVPLDIGGGHSHSVSPSASSPLQPPGETYTDPVGSEPSYYYGHYPPATPKPNVQMYYTAYYPIPQEPTSTVHPGDIQTHTNDFAASTSQSSHTDQRLYATYPPPNPMVQYAPPPQIPNPYIQHRPEAQLHAPPQATHTQTHYYNPHSHPHYSVTAKSTSSIAIPGSQGQQPRVGYDGHDMISR